MITNGLAITRNVELITRRDLAAHTIVSNALLSFGDAIGAAAISVGSVEQEVDEISGEVFVAKNYVHANGLLSAAAAAVYTCPSGWAARITAAVITNIDGATQTCTIYITPSATAVGNSNIVLDAKSLATLVSYSVAELVNQILTAGCKVQALGGNANVISMTLSIEETQL